MSPEARSSRKLSCRMPLARIRFSPEVASLKSVGSSADMGKTRLARTHGKVAHEKRFTFFTEIDFCIVSRPTRRCFCAGSALRQSGVPWLPQRPACLAITFLGAHIASSLSYSRLTRTVAVDRERGLCNAGARGSAPCLTSSSSITT
eukprot:scaffold2830_cov123-Isochrysis_galbana.AAC.11